jgi:hypothetical protein
VSMCTLPVMRTVHRVWGYIDEAVLMIHDSHSSFFQKIFYVTQRALAFSTFLGANYIS